MTISKTILISFLLLLIFFSRTYCQTYSTIISDKEYYNFINQIIDNDSIKFINHVHRQHLELKRDHFYYKDSTDFLNKNNKSMFFIFNKFINNNGRVNSAGLDTIFKREDIDYFDTQIQNMTRVHRWRKPFVNSVLIDEIEYEECENCIGGKTPKFGISWFSLPLFSRDKQYAIIIKENLISYAYYVYNYTSKGDWDLMVRFNVLAND